MKDKKCKNCEEGRVDSKQSKSGLCSKCLGKKWRDEHKEEIRIYHEKYMKKYYQENKAEIYRVNRKYYLNHKEEMDKHIRRYYDENTDKCKKQSKEYYEDNKEEKLKRALERHHERYKTDEGYKIRRLLGTALGSVIRHYIKTGRVIHPMKKYCIDWDGIMNVLTPIPKPRKDYHVDHIIPLYKFDLTNWEQVRIAFAPENHRWLLVKDNLKRSKSKRAITS